MCFGSKPSAPAAPAPPSAPPAPPTMADPAVQAARVDEKKKQRQSNPGLGGTNLTVNLAGQQAGAARTAGGVT